MKLAIAIPALNEENSIEAVILSAISARKVICEQTSVKRVEITVVSDGSTDRTAELALSYADRIQVKCFDKNRGYGAAIKEVWKHSDAEILGYMDADGTCDPDFFAELCRTLEKRKVDLVSGSRLHATSNMPLSRRLGNGFLGFILSLLASARVRDASSSMVVFRSGKLKEVEPLPDGLEFSPALIARSNLSRFIKTCEIEMPYRKRTGKSKLKVPADSLRFFKVVLQAAFPYRLLPSFLFPKKRRT